jgi:hypothetical protein
MHASLGDNLGSAEPDGYPVHQWLPRRGDRGSRLVDEALFLPGFLVFVSHHAGRRISASLGNRFIGTCMRIAK